MKMHWRIFIVYLSLLSPLHAQGAVSSYPYCAQYSDGTSLDCSFSTLPMCYQSVTGVGGVCINNPHAGIPAASNPPHLFGSPYAFAPSPVPPPPTELSHAQQSQNPVLLSGSLSQQATAPPSNGVAPQPPCNPLYDGTFCGTAPTNSFATINSLSSDLSGAVGPPATLGTSTFGGNTDCIGILRALSCGG